MMVPAGFELPQEKADGIVKAFSETGKAWVDNYPNLLAECVGRWQLTLTGVAQAGWVTNVVIFAEDALGRPRVLKLGHPGPEQKTEIIALREYARLNSDRFSAQKRNVVRIVDWDDKTGSFLMEQLIPGTPLRDYSQDHNRSRLRISLFRDLPIPMDSIEELPRYSDWVKSGFEEFRQKHSDTGNDGHTNDFPDFIALAESTFAALLHKHPGSYMLHGDLHHENILRDASGAWCAIDPKGILGPRVMECGRYMHNFIEDEIAGVSTLADATDRQMAEIYQIRMETLSRVMDVEKSDIAAAGFIDLVLCSCWSLNSNQKADLNLIRALSAFL